MSPVSVDIQPLSRSNAELVAFVSPSIMLCYPPTILFDVVKILFVDGVLRSVHVVCPDPETDLTRILIAEQVGEEMTRALMLEVDYTRTIRSLAGVSIDSDILDFARELLGEGTPSHSWCVYRFVKRGDLFELKSVEEPTQAMDHDGLELWLYTSVDSLGDVLGVGMLPMKDAIIVGTNSVGGIVDRVVLQVMSSVCTCLAMEDGWVCAPISPHVAPSKALLELAPTTPIHLSDSAFLKLLDEIEVAFLASRTREEGFVSANPMVPLGTFLFPEESIRRRIAENVQRCNFIRSLIRTMSEPSMNFM